jgi:hypothetical protein
MKKNLLWLCLVLSVCPLLAAQTAPPTRTVDGPHVRVVRPGLAGSAVGSVLTNHDLYVSVLEAQQGQRDLSGDSDTNDEVLHRVSFQGGTVTNLGAVGRPAYAWGGHLVFSTDEQHQRRDLNGDGDRLDTVWQSYDEASGTITNSHLALPGGIWFSQGLVAIGVSENAQNADLNGDGDRTDTVLHAWRLGVAAPVNLHFAIQGIAQVLASDRILFSLSETQTGDRNGDGDALDSVLHVYDASTSVTTSLGLAAQLVMASDDTVAFLVPEADQGGIDLNGDGDALDDVVHTYDAAHGIENLRLASAQTCGLTCSQYLELEPEWVVVNVAEVAQGHTDLDGDGSVAGYVPYAHRIGTSTTVNLQIPRSAWPMARLGEFWAGAEFVTYLRREALEGLDLNGDGDTSDLVLCVRRFDSAERNTGLAMMDENTFNFVLPSDPTREGDWVAFLVGEFAQGGVDRNGDGDAEDAVACMLDTRMGTLRNLRVACVGQPSPFPTFSLHEGTATFYVYEAGQGRDLDADGDLFDDVVHYYDARWDRLVDSGADAYAAWATHGPKRAQAFQVQEGPGRDLNGDGDFQDGVVEVLVIGTRFP